jgi:hypothetical protein
MKIIKNNVESKYPITVDCQHCHSIIEIESEVDLKKITISGSDQRQGDWKYEVNGFHCPACNKDSRLTKEQLGYESNNK